MSQYVEGPDAGLVIEDLAQLIEYFFHAAKPLEEWRIGTQSTNCSACHVGVAAPRATPDGAALSIS